MAKQRYKFESSLELKKVHKNMMQNNFEVKNVSIAKTKDNTQWVFFTVRSSKEEEKIQNHFNKIGIKLIKE